MKEGGGSPFIHYLNAGFAPSVIGSSIEARRLLPQDWRQLRIYDVVDPVFSLRSSPTHFYYGSSSDVYDYSMINLKERLLQGDPLLLSAAHSGSSLRRD
jgi:hypothetical protein